MKVCKKIIVLLYSLALVVVLAGCQDQGPAEKAGESIDEAMENTRQQMEEAGEEMKEAVDETGEKMEEAVEEAGESVEEAGEKMQN